MSNGQTELLVAISRVAAVFRELEIEYFVGGSIASSIFGEPRLTIEADIIARILGRQAESFVDRLGGSFHADLEAIRTAIQNQSSFNLIHLPTMAKVDVFASWRSPFAQSQFARRQPRIIGESPGVELLFASPEDTILAKLHWYQAGGEVSDRPWRDLLGVLKVQGDRLDRDYLRLWAAELGLVPLLERATADAGGSA